jgi:integrase
MARRPMPPGTWGNIKVTQKGPKTWEAGCWYCDWDGIRKRMRRTAHTKTAASEKLKEALASMGEEARSGIVTRDTRIRRVAELYLESLREEYAAGRLSANSLRQYASYVNNWIVPKLGTFTIGQLTVISAENFIKGVHDKRSLETAQSARSVLGSMCRFAMKHRAISINPVRLADKLKAKPEDHKQIRAMTLDERVELREKLAVFCQSKQVDSLGRSQGRRGLVWLALPDLMDVMLSTGVRIGEIIACDGSDADPTNRTVSFNHHIERVAGKGLVRKPGRKAGDPGLTLPMLEWSVPTWRRLKLASGGGPLFASWNGHWLDPSTLLHRFREALNECGFEWVTPRVWRKTVALVMKEAGLSTEAIADQLGNTRRVVEKHYVPKTSQNPQAAAALEGMWKAE